MYLMLLFLVVLVVPLVLVLLVQIGAVASAAMVVSSYVLVFLQVMSATTHGYMGHVYFEASSLILTFVCAGKWIESAAKLRSSDAVTTLLSLAPRTAILLTVDANGMS
jgi:Cu+-exporting ATPase